MLVSKFFPPLQRHAKKKFFSTVSNTRPRIISAMVGPCRGNMGSRYGDYKQRIFDVDDRLNGFYSADKVFPPDERDWTVNTRRFAQKSADSLRNSIAQVLQLANMSYKRSAEYDANTLFLVSFHEHAFSTRAPITLNQYQDLLFATLKVAREFDENLVFVIPTLLLQLEKEGIDSYLKSDKLPRTLKAVSIGLQCGVDARVLMQSAKSITAADDPFYNYPEGRKLPLTRDHIRYQFEIGGPLSFNTPVLSGQLRSGNQYTLFVDMCLTHSSGFGLKDFQQYWQNLSGQERKKLTGFSHLISSNSTHLKNAHLAATHVVFNDSIRQRLSGKMADIALPQAPDENLAAYSKVVTTLPIETKTPFLKNYEMNIMEAAQMGEVTQAVYRPSNLPNVLLQRNLL